MSKILSRWWRLQQQYPPLSAALYKMIISVYSSWSIFHTAFVLVLVYYLRFVLHLVVSISASDCLKILISEITYYVSSGM